MSRKSEDDNDKLLANWQQERRDLELTELHRRLGDQLIDGDRVLLIIQEIRMLYGVSRKETTVISFNDPGSTCSLVLTDFAEKHELLGRPVTITIGTVNGEKRRETKLYMVELLTITGDRKLVSAFGMEHISGEVPYICFEGVKHLFSQSIQDDWGSVSHRPKGEIQLLIGAEVASYFPERLEARGELVVMKSDFGSGYAMFGAHEDLKSDKVQLSEEVQLIRQAGVKISIQVVNRVTVDYVGPKEFMSGESLGVEPPRRCKKCRGCPLSSFRGQKHTEKETLEYKMIEQGVKHNPETDLFEVDYPFIDDPAKLSNNFGQAIKIAESEEKKLLREGLTDEFNQKFDEFLELGTIAEVSQAEMDSWTGPEHYVSIQHVLKPDSVTTRLRLVINSSLRCPKTGLSLNDILAKGPNVLNDIWDLILRFRSYRVGLVSDVTKAYHSMKTGLLEKHVRRVVWRYGKLGTRWRVFAFLVVAFGDRPAAALLEIVIRITCQLYQSVDPLAAFRLENDMFVDDLSSGGELEEVIRFKGSEDFETLACSGTMSQIMEKGGLKFKAMQMSGEPDGAKLEKLGGSVLGIGWSSHLDRFFIDLSANISKQRRGVYVGPNLTEDTLHLLDDAKLTKRICLSLTNKPYDPLGIISPLTIRMKVAMKKMYSGEYQLSWDDELPPDLKKNWVELILMLVKSPRIEIERALMPYTAIGAPTLAVFWDGSNEAFAAVVYAV